MLRLARRTAVNKPILLLSLSLVAAIASAPTRAAAQSDSTRIHAGATFGFGGELKTEPDNDDVEIEDEDLVTTYGAHLGIEVPLIDLLTIGAELGLNFWNTEDGEDNDYDRNTQLDVLVRPKLRFAALDVLEVYAVVPFGYTHFIPSEDNDFAIGGVTGELEGGPGFAIGGSAGATLFLLDHLGLTAEVGYLFRRYGETYKIDAGLLGSGEEEATARFAQMQLRLGLAGAF
jgi:hypothetical protein